MRPHFGQFGVTARRPLLVDSGHEFDAPRTTANSLEPPSGQHQPTLRLPLSPAAGSFGRFTQPDPGPHGTMMRRHEGVGQTVYHRDSRPACALGREFSAALIVGLLAGMRSMGPRPDVRLEDGHGRWPYSGRACPSSVGRRRSEPLTIRRPP